MMPNNHLESLVQYYAVFTATTLPAGRRKDQDKKVKEDERSEEQTKAD